MQLCNQHVCGSLVRGRSRFLPFLCQCSCVCARVRLKMSLLSTMWPRLSFRFSELMLWILLAYVPLNDVGIVSPAPQTHWGLGPQGPLEANAVQGPVEPLAGGPGDYDVPQLFSPQQRELPWTYPEPPVEPESEVREVFQPWRAAMVPQLGLRCGEKKVSIEVNQDLWGNGDLIQPAELTLGGCPHVELDDRARVLAFEYELQDCGSQKLVWSF